MKAHTLGLVFSCVATMGVGASVSTAVLAEQTMSVDAVEGEQLERQIWSDIQAKNWAAVEAGIAGGFQSVHPDGARDRDAELALIKGLDLGDYSLQGFKVTRNNDDLIVSYWISVQETIDGKRLSSKPAMRLSVWEQNASGGWQWVSHANLNPL
jgi:hypothetical protein